MRNALNLIDKQKKIFSLVLSVFLLCSCSDVQKRQKPDKLLPESQMVEIYTDMVLLDAINKSVSKKFQSYNLNASDHFYNKYNIDSTTLADNMAYYNLEFETNADIYTKVNKNVEERKAYIDSVVHLRDSLKKIEQKIKDSLKADSLKVGKVKNLKLLDTNSN